MGARSSPDAQTRVSAVDPVFGVYRADRGVDDALMKALRRTLPVLLGAALWLVPGRGASANAAGQIELFKSPSGNINCGYLPSEVSNPPVVTCEVSAYNGKIAPRPDDCDVDWVASGSVNAKGKVRIWSCQGDTIASPNSKVIAYGATWTKGVFACSSSASGMRCTHKNGQGFSLSSRAVSKF